MNDFTWPNSHDMADEIGVTHASYDRQDGTRSSLSTTGQVICFGAGTRIATPDGPCAVERLAPGDMVITADDGPQPVRWIGKSMVAGVGKLAPIEIRPGGRFDVDQTLHVSPQHRVLVDDYTVQLYFGTDEAFVAAEALIDGRHIVQVERPLMTYVHVMLERHHVIYAEGIPCESFHPADDGLCTLGPAARAALFKAIRALRNNLAAYGPTARPCIDPAEALLLHTLAA